MRWNPYFSYKKTPLPVKPYLHNLQTNTFPIATDSIHPSRRQSPRSRRTPVPEVRPSMAETTENPEKQTEHNQTEEEEEVEDLTFEELGLDPRLTRALLKKRILKPTPIQRVAIPLVLVGFFHQLSVSIGRTK